MTKEIQFLLENFPDALTAIGKRFLENEPKKKGKWKSQTLHAHLNHLSGHYNLLKHGDPNGDDNLCAIGARSLTALQIRSLK